MINLSQAIVYNSPADVATWPITTTITDLHMRSSGESPDGVSMAFSALNSWPDYVPPGWDGGLQYTVWPVVRINGQWYTSGIIQMWRGRPSTGAPLPSQWYNWAYDARWGPMNYNGGFHPQAGDVLGFFVTAGDARGQGGVTSVRERSNVVLLSFPAGDHGDWTFTTQVVQNPVGDIDGDRRSEIAIFRPSSGQWRALLSTHDFTLTASINWGAPGDIPVPADYDGDGRADLAVFRPSTGAWWILLSSSSYTSYWTYSWGANGDVPVPGDYDGDGKADVAVFRPSTGAWWVRFSTNGGAASYGWGAAGDKPLAADFDGDGRADLAIYRPSTGAWWVSTSSSGFTAYSTYQWGGANDVPIAGDFDGDGKTDLAVYSRSTGSWWIRWSSTGFNAFSSYAWGGSGDVPLSGDFDGDGKVDIAVYSPSMNGWWILWSSSGYTQIGLYILGAPGDVALLGH